MLADGTDPAASAPETLQGVVAARIDALPNEEKELLQLAAVLGKVFWTDALSSLSASRTRGSSRSACTRSSARSSCGASIARPSPARSSTSSSTLSCATGRTARCRARREPTSIAASPTGSRRFPPTGQTTGAEILAHHLLEAIEYSRAAGLDDAELVPRAAKALRESGDRAWGIGALGAARDFYTRLRELDPSVEDDPYFLLAIGLSLAQGRFEEEGANELERAAAALAESDPAAAAQAIVTRGEFVWQRGEQEGAFAYFDRARVLVEDASVSPEKQYVVAQVARFLALAGRYEEAQELAEQAIDMAEELGDDELLGDALNTRGMVRASLGDPRWEDDSVRSVELALRQNSFRAGRAYLNLGSHLVDTAGDLPRAEAVSREALAFIRKMGFASGAERWVLGNLADMAYLAGRWDEALTLAEQVIAGEPHYMLQVGLSVRAEIRMARGDRAGAAEDTEWALQRARAIRDPQALDPALVIAAEVAYRNGDVVAASKLLDELGSPERTAGTWVVIAALLQHELGRRATVAVGQGDGLRTPWSEAALAIGDGDLARAADIVERTGARTLEAAVRLRAAQKYAGEGRRAEAAEQLAPALAFYREVGASAYVREAEALLAAAS